MLRVRPESSQRSALDVADGAADLGDDEVELPLGCIGHDPALDFVGDVRDHLDRLPEIIAPAFLVDDRLVDLPGRHRVPPGGPDAGEALVVPEVQVRLHPVLRDIALSVLIRIQRARVDIDVRIELLDGDAVAAALKQLADTGGDNPLSQGGNDASGDENEKSARHLF